MKKLLLTLFISLLPALVLANSTHFYTGKQVQKSANIQLACGDSSSDSSDSNSSHS